MNHSYFPLLPLSRGVKYTRQLWNYVGLKDVNSLQKRTKGKKAAKKRVSAMMKTALFFGFAVVILVGVLLAPSPSDGKKSGIELYGEDPDIEIYGPELPQSTVESYPVPIVESPILPDATSSAEETTYVYASDDQKCYHASTCKYAYASGHRFTVQEAQLLGYKPCGKCNPPTA